jgi:hypothetical protein
MYVQLRVSFHVRGTKEEKIVQLRVSFHVRGTKEEKIEEICRVISTTYFFRYYIMRKNK